LPRPSTAAAIIRRT
jgi:hypothetical protein